MMPTMKSNKEKAQKLLDDIGLNPFLWTEEELHKLRKETAAESFKELSERYGHYFDGVDPVEYVKEMRGEVDRNAYTFTGECCDQ